MREVRVPKLCIKKTGHVSRTNAWLSPTALVNLEFLRAFYSRHLDRDVSISLVFRRALEALAGHVKNLHQRADRTSIKREAIEIVKHIRGERRPT